MASPDLGLILPIAGAALAEAIGLGSDQALAIETDLAALTATARTGVETTAAIEDLATTLAAAAAEHSGNPTIVNAAKVIGDFAPAKADLEAGQAVVIASPTIDGRACILVLAVKGGTAAAALGV